MQRVVRRRTTTVRITLVEQVSTEAIDVVGAPCPSVGQPPVPLPVRPRRRGRRNVEPSKPPVQ